MSRNDVKIADPPRNDRPADKFRCGQLCQGGGMGNCPRGPRPNGTCDSDTDPCEPVRTFRGFRRRMIKAVTFLGIVGIAIWMSIDSNGLLKPGDLSHPHAVIFSGHSGTNQCAACHPNAALSVTQWFSGEDVFHNRFAQTDSCVTCHHVKMPADVARSPHNLSSERLTEIRAALAEAATSGLATDEPGARAGLQFAAVSVANKSSHSFDSIECASCHREHGGVNAIMTAMSNAQCQSCHSRTFENFGNGHPDWKAWPHVGPKVLAFDHATHQRLYFPKASQKSDNDEAGSPGVSAAALGRAFDCRTCHPGTSVSSGNPTSLVSIGGNNDSEPLRTVSYEVACADCHSAGLREQANQRMDLFALPTMTESTVADLGKWPTAATGFFDGDIGPLTRWLISNQPATITALARLPGSASITQIDTANRDQVRAAVVAAASIRHAMDDFATRGSNVLTDRENDRAAQAMRQVLRTVPPQLIADAQRQWFDSEPAVSKLSPPQYEKSLAISARPFFNETDRLAQSPPGSSSLADDLLEDELLLGDATSQDATSVDADDVLGDSMSGVDQADPLLGDPLSNDPLADDPLDSPAGAVAATSGNVQRFEPANALPDGGWYRDDLRLAISYRGSGHADPVLKAAVELAANLPGDDPVRGALLATSAVASCVRCHVGAMRSDAVLWRTPVGPHQTKALTKFSHQPHFNLPQLSDCSHCHMTHTDAASIEEIAKLKSTPDYDLATSHGFISLGKAACISCHTQGAAGDNCTQCHHYHSQK
ncbi:MAG TPA: hypothetical protein DDZ51_29215 [Planctomycetaceae bacterium]|nr:hypothetical protein [Planctomycetaceae bacterium]